VVAVERAEGYARAMRELGFRASLSVTVVVRIEPS
jgi:hypothetical protein